MDQRRADRQNASEVRQCCATNVRQPHAESCRRQPGRCADKKAYPTRELAQATLDKVNGEWGLMNVYRCASCLRWHIGHPKTVDEARSDA